MFRSRCKPTHYLHKIYGYFTEVYFIKIDMEKFIEVTNTTSNSKIKVNLRYIVTYQSYGNQTK